MFNTEPGPSTRCFGCFLQEPRPVPALRFVAEVAAVLIMMWDEARATQGLDLLSVKYIWGMRHQGSGMCELVHAHMTKPKGILHQMRRSRTR